MTAQDQVVVTTSGGVGDPLRVITVRLPSSLHERVRDLCRRVTYNTHVHLSINGFCLGAIERALEAFDGQGSKHGGTENTEASHGR